MRSIWLYSMRTCKRDVSRFLVYGLSGGLALLLPRRFFGDYL